VGPDQTATDPAERPGLLSVAEIDMLVENIHQHTAGASRRATGWAASNLDVYQVNSTYYDALGRDDRRYLAARAFQFFIPGIPQVYYVGALAGINDLDLLARTGVGRDINRHFYTPEEVVAALDRPVVRALLALCRFRNDFDVFDGAFDFATDATHRLRCSWHAGRGTTERRAELVIDLTTGATALEWEANGTVRRTDDLLEDPPAV
jgi:sucrose phosphorylase